MHSTALPVNESSKRGDLVRSDAGPVGRYIGTLGGVVWIAYELEGFAASCETFDKAALALEPSRGR